MSKFICDVHLHFQLAYAHYATVLRTVRCGRNHMRHEVCRHSISDVGYDTLRGDFHAIAIGVISRHTQH
jgi:hypothetical protein